jgi:hypothetical protein
MTKDQTETQPAVGSSALVSPIMNTTQQIQSGSAAGHGQGRSPILLSGYEGRGGFRRWLLTLERGGCMFHEEARIFQSVPLYETALRRWREAGHPDPGEWPDTSDRPGFEMSSYTHEWMERWANAKVSDGGGPRAPELANKCCPPPFAQPKSWAKLPISC